MRTTGSTLIVAVLVALSAGGIQTASTAAEKDYASADEKSAAGQEVKVDEATMSQWERKKADQDWVAEEMAKHQIVPPADNSDLIGKGQGATYGKITEEDVAIWKRETLKLVAEGSRIFHSADDLGSEIAVSCDMCHPDASNTHPETYPKFQVQMGRVALLRDMINWCIQQPVRGKKLEADGPKMRALEAYIYAQRKGTALQYGKR